MPDRQYVYRVTEVVKVADGDTYWCRVDVGFRQEVLTCFRLLGYDCPERTKGSGFERAEGLRAKNVAGDWLAAAAPDLWVRTEKDPDNFGRWLGEFYDTAERLGEALSRARLASVWPRRWREEFDL